MELRQLRFVVTLAETLSFRRTAELEHITQSTISEQVARLEREVGARLFDRGPHGVRITEAGRLVVERAHAILNDFATTAEEAREIASGASGRLTIGIFAEGLAELTPLVIRAFRSSSPRVELTFTELTIENHAQAVRDGDVDVAVVRPPLYDPSLAVHELFREPRLAALDARRTIEHPSLSVDALLDEPVVTTTPRSWGTFWSCDDLRGGTGRSAGIAASVSESLNCVAYLGAVDTLPASSARYYRHPGVRYLPVSGLPDASAAVAHRADDRRAIVQAFRLTAEHVSARHLDVVPDAQPPEAA